MEAREDDAGFELWLGGKVVSWKRNRVSRGGRVFRDKEGLAYRKLLAESVRIARGGVQQPLRAPLAVYMVCTMPRPAKRNTRAVAGAVPREVWATGERCQCPTTNKDDIDRLQGNVLDALKDAGAIGDDGHVTYIEVRKVYAKEGEVPGLELRVVEGSWLA